MKNESLKQKDSQSNITQESTTYDGGKLNYLHINAEHADPVNNKLVVIPGFTQGIEVLGDFGEALSNQGNREVYVLDQPDRSKKKFDKKLKGEIGLNDQVNAFIAFLEQNGLTDEPVDFVVNSLGAAVLANAAVKANENGWKTFKSDEGSNSFFISPAAVDPKENIISLGKRFVRSATNNASLGKVLDPTGEMLKAGQKNFTGDMPKSFNEAIALAKYKIDFESLEESGVKPMIIGYADDSMMPHVDNSQNLERIEGAVSLIDNANNAPNNLPAASDFEQFKERTGLDGKEAKRAWAHHYRAAEHNDMQFHPERTARFIGSVLVDKAQKLQK
jgi:hypothetical protein